MTGLVICMERSWKRIFKPWTAVLIGVFLGLIYCSAAKADQEVSLGWDADTTGTVAGYAVYYGTSSGNYTSRIDVGTNTSFTLADLQPGATYFFAVAAYTADQESPISGEVPYIVPGLLQVIPPTSGDPNSNFMTVQFPVAPGHWYEVQTTVDFLAWQTIWETPVESTNDWVQVQDTRPMTLSGQFYRLVQH